MPQLTGIVKIKLNGKLIRSKDGAKLDTGGKERTMQTGHKVYGYTEKIIPSVMECVISHAKDTSILELNNLVGATVNFECDTGTVFTIGNAVTSAPCSLTGGDGDISLKMSGDPAEES